MIASGHSTLRVEPRVRCVTTRGVVRRFTSHQASPFDRLPRTYPVRSVCIRPFFWGLRESGCFLRNSFARSAAWRAERPARNLTQQAIPLVGVMSVGFCTACHPCVLFVSPSNAREAVGRKRSESPPRVGVAAMKPVFRTQVQTVAKAGRSLCCVLQCSARHHCCTLHASWASIIAVHTLQVVSYQLVKVRCLIETVPRHAECILHRP